MELENTNIISYKPLIPPNELEKKLPINKEIKLFVLKTRREIERIISKDSDKLLFIVGPCSIHNPEEALIYGKKLKGLSEKVKDKILIVMRTYFEKPRTTIGWKGLINDPDLNNTFNVNDGLYKARKLLIQLNMLKLPCGYEVLDTITPQYISELMSWGAVGARTTESQVHRQLVSGLSMPVGFKNGTGGSLDLARDAILSAAHPHCFMGISQKGVPSICSTRGNENCHIILRGGSKGPNYKKPFIEECQKKLREKNLKEAIMVDCSHGNSRKNHKNQHLVLENIMNQYLENNKISSPIMGIMMESNLNEGNQKYDPKNPYELKKGVSITDSCISFEETEKIILETYKKLNQ